MKIGYLALMGDNGAHIRLKLDTDQPIALADFVAEFVGIGNQFDKFIAREYPDLKAESEIFIEEVRSGCIEADLVAWIVGGALSVGATAKLAIDFIDKGQILTKFVKDVGERISPYFRKGGRTKDASKSDLVDFLKTTKAIARDPNGTLSLEAAVFEDGKRNVRAAFQFSSDDARQAETEIGDHRRELETKIDENQERVLLQFVRPSVEAGKPGKKGGERGVITSIHKRALPILYASTLAEERMLHEKMQLEGNVFRALFDVSVNVELSATGKPLAYRITAVHNVIENGDEADLIDS
ncbi:hypothetical protein H0274_12565 [Altererythrobacter sp. CC-YST694]|uniref:hypothetical protein n=1 Tax=Altererythrobacter sp. CC-YST694 TaxID=2755038 RepID=UPI001D03468F|nr:hypothetical protein [Altererythrobacter sp. CC-YST694]MCB5426094.1 hypothetical protein [Altererythrobacter sp. CC-YST694]